VGEIKVTIYERVKLDNKWTRVADPTVAAVVRKKLADEIPSYLEAKSGCKKTVSAHRLALTEFQGWATQQKKGRGIRCVDEITKPLLRQFFDYLVDGNEDEDGPANTPFTAAHKVMKVNSFYREVFHLEPGKGVITKKDYKRELTSSKVPETFPKQEMDAMFAVMDEDEHLSTISELPKASIQRPCGLVFFGSIVEHRSRISRSNSSMKLSCSLASTRGASAGSSSIAFRQPAGGGSFVR
jgi:hypothetical protein